MNEFTNSSETSASNTIMNKYLIPQGLRYSELDRKKESKINYNLSMEGDSKTLFLCTFKTFKLI